MKLGSFSEQLVMAILRLIYVMRIEANLSPAHFFKNAKTSAPEGGHPVQ
jgi:hypothetical protein